MRFANRLFVAGYVVISLMFFCCALALLCFAALRLWAAISWASELSLVERLDDLLETIALLTIAVASLELGQTILEEEVVRESEMSAPTRVRRFLSRFMIVLVVSLSIETLVAVFKFTHEDPAHLPYAASIGLVAAALLAAWGVFVKLNRSAEELEPEAMADIKRDDEKIADC
jgi:hypothetical protein